MSATKINPLEALHIRKAELAMQCKAKEQEIHQQFDYVSEHIGAITIQSIVGDKFNKGAGTKTEIIKLLVAEGIDTAINIKKDPHNIKEKLLEFFKEAASGVLNLVLK